MPHAVTFEAALALYRSGQREAATEVCRALLEREGGDRNALQLLAFLRVQAGDPGEAAGLFARLTALDPDSVDAWANRAAALRTAGRADAAAAAAGIAVALDPVHESALLTLANARAQQERPAPADALYGRVLALVPGHAAALKNRAFQQTKHGERLRGAAALTAAARQGGGADAWAAAAGASFSVGDDRAAKAQALTALATVPAHPLASRVLGEVLLDRSGLGRVASGKPFAVRRALAEEAVRLLATAADAGDERAAGLRLAAVSALVLVGMASPALLRDGARAAWQRLKREPKDCVAAAVVGYHVYRCGRLRLAGWLNRRFQARFTPAEAAADLELGIWRMLRTDDAFFAALPPVDALIAEMAPVTFLDPSPCAAATADPFVLFACDEVYFRRFGDALLESVATCMPGATAVAHVFGPSAATRADLDRWQRDPRLSVAISSEEPATAGWTDIKRFTYYASGRFVRALQWQRRLGRPMIVVDTDATIVADLRALGREMEGFDLGPLIDHRQRGPSREVTVCFTWYADTPACRHYLETVAAYIAWMLRGDEVFWMLDQMAHFVVLDRMRRDGALRVHAYDFPSFPHCRFVGAK